MFEITIAFPVYASKPKKCWRCGDLTIVETTLSIETSLDEIFATQFPKFRVHPDVSADKKSDMEMTAEVPQTRVHSNFCLTKSQMWKYFAI